MDDRDYNRAALREVGWIVLVAVLIALVLYLLGIR